MIKYLIHLYKNIRYFGKKRKSIKKLKERHFRSGVFITYYNWFSIEKGFYLQNATIPDHINQFTIIDWETLRRRPKRKVINKFNGSSLFSSINAAKIRLKNIIRTLRKKV